MATIFAQSSIMRLKRKRNQIRFSSNFDSVNITRGIIDSLNHNTNPQETIVKDTTLRDISSNTRKTILTQNSSFTNCLLHNKATKPLNLCSISPTPKMKGMTMSFPLKKIKAKHSRNLSNQTSINNGIKNPRKLVNSKREASQKQNQNQNQTGIKYYSYEKKKIASITPIKTKDTPYKKDKKTKINASSRITNNFTTQNKNKKKFVIRPMDNMKPIHTKKYYKNKPVEESPYKLLMQNTKTPLSSDKMHGNKETMISVCKTDMCDVSKSNDIKNSQPNFLTPPNILSNAVSSNSIFSKKETSSIYSHKTNHETVSNKSILISKTMHSIAKISQVGFAGVNKIKINQDSTFIFSPEGAEYHFIGVCDGHGKNGHLVSQFVSDSLPTILDKEIKENNITISSSSISKVSKIIDNAFIQTNSKLLNDSSLDTSLSGSTCVSVLFTNDKLYCANIGDSRGILGKYNQTINKWDYLKLSRDHKPSEPDESKRIIRFGGRIDQYKETDGTLLGPKRVWLKNKEMPGLAMSRSFGDQIASRVGVTCEPEIKETHFSEDDKFIILASDGLWEQISNSKCLEIISFYYHHNKDADEAVKNLYHFALKKWIEKETIIDDITIVLIYFD